MPVVESWVGSIPGTKQLKECLEPGNPIAEGPTLPLVEMDPSQGEEELREQRHPQDPGRILSGLSLRK